MVNNFYKQIGLSPEAIQFLAEHPLPQTDYAEWEALFHCDFSAFLSGLESEPDGPQLFFSFAARYACAHRKSALQRGISEEVWWDSMRDIAIWERNYRTTYKASGILSYEWVSRSLSGRVIRLGRLQFELLPLPYTCTVQGVTLPAGTIVLNVHIPAELPLLPAAVEASYQQALHFFHGTAPVFFCESWLLNPTLRDIIHKNSNILTFASRYTIVNQEPACRQAEERVFGTLCESPAQYPENSALQRAARKYLMSGHSLGIVSGVFIADSDMLF